MRKRRVIIFNGDSHTRSALRHFFEARGYETVLFRAPVICPVYEKGEECSGPRGCGDIVIMSSYGSAMNGIDLLVAQQERGCKLPASNKAIIAGSLPDEGRAKIAALGSALFQTPLDFNGIETWVAECEGRMDLDRPVAIRRRGERQASSGERLSVFHEGAVIERVTVVNKSTCGVCLRTSLRLMPNELIILRADSPGTEEDVLVRWVKKTEDGTFLVGLSSCI